MTGQKAVKFWKNVKKGFDIPYTSDSTDWKTVSIIDRFKKSKNCM